MVKGWRKHPAACSHPGKRHGFGLCGTCYVTRRRELDSNWHTKRLKVQRRYYRKKQREQAKLPVTIRSLERYGITLEDAIALFESQGRVCAICKRNPHKKKRLHLDHDHRTKKVRGFLCARCNTALAVLEDKHGLKSAMEAYLLHHAASR